MIAAGRHPFAQLKSAVESVEIVGLNFAWCGHMQDRVSDVRDLDHLELLITQQLYVNFYLSGGAVQASSVDRSSRGWPTSQDVNALRSANAGNGQWQSDWALVGRDGEAFQVQRGRSPTLWIEQDDIQLCGEGRAVVKLPNEMLHFFPGFYCAVSDKDFEPSKSGALRFYWNLQPGAGPAFVRSATQHLNSAGCGFILKAAYAQTAQTRCDNGLIVVERDAQEARNCIRAIYADLGAVLRPSTPALTKPMVEGLAVAEDPPSRESFGWHRCSLISKALVHASCETPEPEGDQRLACVVSAFEEVGLDAHAPWGDVEGFGDEDFLHSLSAPRISPQHFDPFRVARDIGRALTEDAIWFGEQCTWLGFDPVDIRALDAPASESILSADPYDGTAGVGLFLAELAARCGDDQIKSCALGALRYAMNRVELGMESSKSGLLQGPLAVVAMTARAAQALGSEPLRADVARWIASGADAEHILTGFDLLGGKAGAILSRLSLGHTGDGPTALDGAKRLAEALIADGQTPAEGLLCWISETELHRRALTGFAHGTSGAAHALYELHVATGERVWKDAAERALRYEERSFDRDRGQWWDLRNQSSQARRHFAMAWCHGTPGMLIPRIRAFELENPIIGERDFKAAIDATQRWVLEHTRSIHANFSLCHGVLGNLEILLEAKRRLDGTIEINLDETADVPAYFADCYAADPLSWPCGGGDGSTPSLMLGFAGIGLFYLRLADPCVPSVIVPRIEHHG